MIYVTGDTHGTFDMKKVNNWYIKNHKKLSEDDILIQLGDWGAIWHNRDNYKKYLQDLKLQRNWSKRNFTTLVVLGNHENYDLIKKLPIIEMFGGKVRELKPHNPYNPNGNYKSIYLLERGEIYTIDNKTFLALGGADSIDKADRKEGISWWSGELWSKEEEENCIRNLEKHNWSVDYVVAHTCPVSIAKKFLTDIYNKKLLDPTAKFFQDLLDKGLEFNKWHFGHFHQDLEIGKFRCHYEGEPVEIDNNNPKN